MEQRSRDYIAQGLQNLADSDCLVWPVTSHVIGPGEYAISKERLTWIFERSRELGLSFYISEDFGRLEEAGTGVLSGSDPGATTVLP